MTNIKEFLTELSELLEKHELFICIENFKEGFDVDVCSNNPTGIYYSIKEDTNICELSPEYLKEVIERLKNEM